MATNEPVSGASAAKVDMKFEVIVIPVADVDRSKAWALFESQADLLRRQVDNRARDCADIAGDWLITVWRQLNPNCPFHGVALRRHKRDDLTPQPPHTFHSQL